MNKNVKKIRRSIGQRKKLRGLSPEETSDKQTMPVMPQDEEKHGYLPTFPDVPFQGGNKIKLLSGMMLKGVFSVLLLMGAALLSQTDSSLLSKPRGWTSSALTEEFPFARVNLWYQETFGAPLAFAPQPKEEPAGESHALPVSGNVTESFQSSGKGVQIAPDETAPVSALRDGVVIFAGSDRETDKTVVVQHADGSKSTYGHLSSVDVHLYQLINASQQLGQFQPGDENETVYFSIEKNKEYMDPVQVIKVDDNS